MAVAQGLHSCHARCGTVRHLPATRHHGRRRAPRRRKAGDAIIGRMTAYMLLKLLHVLSSTVLFGTGMGIAFFK